eukprot:GILK01006608.1.p1 GENE.GILK01006608.1~~GILK01006608.1.p1  ORF type:complete len:365 (-),score=16.38 GILK01006608.1:441-1466(-)
MEVTTSCDRMKSEPKTCRICFEGESDSASPLIAPCACRGTQEFVHTECLQHWRRTVFRQMSEHSAFDGPVSDWRAHFCCVCKEKYNIPAPSEPISITFHKFMSRVTSPFKSIWIPACILLGALSFPFVLFFLFVLCVFYGILCCRGVRPILRTDDAGHTRLAFIPYGAALDGLRVGTVLVASPSMRSDVFGNSVVLIYELSRDGVKGLILNNPIGPEAVTRMHDFGLLPQQLLANSVFHGVGGPVGQRAWNMLHTCHGINGSIQVVPGVFLGGETQRVISHLAQDGAIEVRVKVLYGYTSWAEGQLEGEVRAGQWKMLDGSYDKIFHSTPFDHWQHLYHYS